jgi:hypothetical protein
MNNLFYSSKEMYSSTHLIRHNKEVFDKISSNEISKAVILRDGKPSFILVDFDKYEKFMIAYNKMQKKSSKEKQTTKQTTIQTQKQETQQIKEPKEIKEKINPAKVVPPTPKAQDDIVEDEISIEEESVQEDILDKLGFDDEFKKEIEDKLAQTKPTLKINTLQTKKQDDSKKVPLKEFWE